MCTSECYKLKFVFLMVGVLSLPLPMSVLVRVCFNNTACADVVCPCLFQVIMRPKVFFFGVPGIVWSVGAVAPLPPLLLPHLSFWFSFRAVELLERTPSKKVDVPSRCPWSSSSCTVCPVERAIRSK